MHVLMLLGTLVAADAAEIEAWERTDFARSSELAGSDGWLNGFDWDEWYGTSDGQYAVPTTDMNNSDSGGGAYGSGWAADNWLIRGDAVGQGRTRVRLFNEDDDTAGVVFAHDSHDSFYLVAWSANSTPPPMDALENRGAFFLIRVQDGDAAVLASATTAPRREGFDEIVVGLQDGIVFGELNGERLIEVEDGSPLAPGKSGFYAYDAGYDGNNDYNTNVYFDEIEVAYYDDDADTIRDDTDNCEKDANTDQADDDSDGVGNACDPDWVEPDTDAPSDTDDDTDPTTDTDTTGQPVDGGAEEIGADCGCRTATPVGMLPWGLALLAGLRRRR